MTYIRENLKNFSFYHEDDIIKKRLLYYAKVLKNTADVSWKDSTEHVHNTTYNIEHVLNYLNNGTWIISESKQLPIFN